MTGRIRLAVALCAALLAGVGQTGSEVADAFETATQRWLAALNAQDESTLRSLLTGDVELLDGQVAGAAGDGRGTRVVGRDAAARALREIVRDGRLLATTRDSATTAGLAWRVVGFTQRQKNGDMHARGEALEIWKREDGAWRLHRQMSTGLMAGGPRLTRPSTREPVLDRPAN